MSRDPQNKRRVEESLTGEEIAALNQTAPGLGNKLHRMFSAVGSALSAQSGLKGPVAVAKQTGKDVTGKEDPAVVLDDDRISGVADPVEDLDAVNLRTLRRYAQADPEDNLATPNPLKEVCRPVAISNMKAMPTGMTEIYAVEVLNEFVYVAGVDDSTPRFEVYLLFGENEMRLLGALTQSEAFNRMYLQGHYIYGCRTNGGSTNLTIIDIKKPEAPDEVVVFDVGAAARGVHAQGGYVYIATATPSVRIVDVSNPAVPVVVGTAS